MMRAAVALVAFAATVPGQLRLFQPDDLPARRKAAAVLAEGLQALRESGPEDGAARFHAALEEAQALLPVGSAARAVADELVARDAAPGALAGDAAELRADLAFTPLAEAELPEGVPGFTVLDEVELRSYPSYRMVRTGMKGGTLGAFWPLFRHIQSREIAMTTPVQIDYGTADEGRDGDRARQVSMAFLYGSPKLGRAGQDGAVEVVDVPATTVLTIGSRGYDRPARIAELQARLTAWLAANPQWQASGPIRMMAYNSPSVDAARRCFEVQIPVVHREPVPRGESV